jgi:hypothetical protein
VTSDDQLRSLLHAHAHDAPDAAAVHAAVRATLTRKRRQRHAAQTLGVAVVIGGLALVPILADHRTENAQQVAPILGSPGTSLPASTPPDATQPPATSAQDDAVDAFFDRHYTYPDAVELSSLWHVGDIYLVKKLAGQQLRDGATLPIVPGQQIASVPGSASRTQQDLQAFTEHGYGEADAQQLAALWHEDDLSLVKMLAGQQLLDGVSLNLP